MAKKKRDDRRHKATSLRYRASSLSSIQAVVSGGKAVVSADNSTIIAMVQEALNGGRMSTTFYVPPALATAVMRWYLTPRRIKEMEIELVSKAEMAKIKSELGVNLGAAFTTRSKCPNGHDYGLFEFIQQGIREHGREFACAVSELKNASVLRINPVQDLICARCGERLIIFDHPTYGMYDDRGTLIYGCCKGELPGPILT